MSIKILITKDFGVKEESEVAVFFVFSHIRMMGYFRLGNVRGNECPAGLEPPAGARNMGKATVKIRRNLPHHQTDQVRRINTTIIRYHWMP